MTVEAERGFAPGRPDDVALPAARGRTASALPLGFSALMVATVTFACLELGWIGRDEARTLALAVLVFTPPAQLLGSVVGFAAGDTVVGTAMGVLACTWAATCLVTWVFHRRATDPALGVLLLAASAALMVAASAADRVVAVAVLATASTRFAVTGVYELTASPPWKLLAGAVGLGLGLVALYATTAVVLEETRGRPVLPTGRRR